MAGLVSVINQIEGLIITLRDGRYSTITFSECGKAATFPSETYTRFGVNATPATQRVQSLTTVSFRVVQFSF